MPFDRGEVEGEELFRLAKDEGVRLGGDVSRRGEEGTDLQTCVGAFIGREWLHYFERLGAEGSARVPGAGGRMKADHVGS